MTYVITEACLDVMDRSCVENCPVDCIHEGERMLYIDPEACIDCGACESVCPQTAIFFDEALPTELDVFRTINAEFTAEHGARDDGERAPDHPLIARKPRGS